MRPQLTPGKIKDYIKKKKKRRRCGHSTLLDPAIFAITQTQTFDLIKIITIWGIRKEKVRNGNGSSKPSFPMVGNQKIPKIDK